MLTINQADLFYAAEYALEALLLLLCTWQRGTLDIRRQIGRKVFFRRLLLVLFVSVLGIALMTGIYFIRLEPASIPAGQRWRRYLSSCMGYRISLCPAK